jgi:hypothetical protein
MFGTEDEMNFKYEVVINRSRFRCKLFLNVEITTARRKENVTISW